MIKYFCDRCKKELHPDEYPGDALTRPLFPTVALTQPGFNKCSDKHPNGVRRNYTKSFTLCDVCFDNVIGYIEESKI